ncbi:MAG: hypothetical protein AAGA29_00415 [Planctomycetota bacterium]
MPTLTKALIAISSVLLVALIAVTTLFLLTCAKNGVDRSHVAMERQQAERLKTERDEAVVEQEKLRGELAMLRSELEAAQSNDEADPEAETDPGAVFDELAAARDQLASVKEQLAAAELLRDQAEHDTTMWRQQVERERRRAGTADATQQDEDIAALSAELVEQAAANSRLTTTLETALKRLNLQNEQLSELTGHLTWLSRELARVQEGSDPGNENGDRLEELHADIAQLHSNFARVAAENYDLTVRLETAEAERDAYERQLEQMLMPPGQKLRETLELLRKRDELIVELREDLARRTMQHDGSRSLVSYEERIARQNALITDLIRDMANLTRQNDELIAEIVALRAGSGQDQ